MTENILQKADKITSHDRPEDYAHPRIDLPRIGKLWSAYLGTEVTDQDDAMMMVLLKTSRQKHKFKLDNLIDIAGWARCAEKLVDEGQE